MKHTFSKKLFIREDLLIPVTLKYTLLFLSVDKITVSKTNKTLS